MEITTEMMKQYFEKDVQSIRDALMVEGKPPIKESKLHEFYDKATALLNGLGLTDQQAVGALFALAATKAEVHNKQSGAGSHKTERPN